MFLTNELVIFLKTIIYGMGIGIIFDFFRITRKIIPHKDVFVIMQDVMFCLLTGIYLFILLYYLNCGQIRLYILIGILISNIIYILIFSKYLINIFMYIFNPLKLLFVKIRQKKQIICKKDLKN